MQLREQPRYASSKDENVREPGDPVADLDMAYIRTDLDNVPSSIAANKRTGSTTHENALKRVGTEVSPACWMQGRDTGPWRTL